MQEKTANISKEMEMLEIKNIGKELKNNFDVFINKLYMAKKRISESEDLSIETSQTEKKKNEKNNWEFWRPIGQFQRCNTHIRGMLEGKKERKEKMQSWCYNGWEFSKINEVSKQKSWHLNILYSDYRKSKKRENLKKPEGEKKHKQTNHFTFGWKKLRTTLDFSSETMKAER